MRYLITSGVIALALSSSAFAQVMLKPPAKAEAEGSWQVCNETSYILRLATATKKNDTLTAKGWKRLRSGACEAIPAVPNTPRYVYAESTGAYQGGIREWAGRTTFCVGEGDFSVTGDIGCAKAGYETRQYMAVPEDETVTKFVEPDNFTRRAETAGIQRLLKENGYRVSRIDGVAGRRTTRTLAQFIKDKRLAANLTTDQKIDALEKASIARMEDLGVKICNKSSQRIWAAVGKRHGDDWESQGWWAVETGACIQPVTEGLKKLEAHIFARQEQPAGADGVAESDKHLRGEESEPNLFCISEAKFSARGRTECLSNGYDAVNFRELPNDQDGVTVNLTDADFVAVTGAGLRR